MSILFNYIGFFDKFTVFKIFGEHMSVGKSVIFKGEFKISCIILDIGFVKAAVYIYLHNIKSAYIRILGYTGIYFALLSAEKGENIFL